MVLYYLGDFEAPTGTVFININWARSPGGGPNYAKMRRPKMNNPARWLKRSAFPRFLERAIGF
jgi:hypothetical protein